VLVMLYFKCETAIDNDDDNRKLNVHHTSWMKWFLLQQSKARESRE
jgi:hypothetical protein